MRLSALTSTVKQWGGSTVPSGVTSRYTFVPPPGLPPPPGQSSKTFGM